MRIVGGALAGRRFTGPSTKLTRPTSDRVREAIASILEARGALERARVLDLWSGTGALAFEALSRGAQRATLVEKDRRVSRAIEVSASALGLADRVDVVRADLEGTGWIERLDGCFDVVFADPPYARIARVEPVLEALRGCGALSADASIVVEHARRGPPTLPEGIEEVRAYRYGDTSVLLAAHRGETTEEP